jgi:hypothetical protein
LRKIPPRKPRELGFSSKEPRSLEIPGAQAALNPGRLSSKSASAP